MRKSSFFQVYTNGRLNGRLGLIAKRPQSGVYIIKLNDSIVYVGYSGSNLYKTFSRHFQSWNDATQKRVTFNNRRTSEKITARIILCSPQRAATLEKALILHHRPRLNGHKYEAYTMDFKEKSALDDYRAAPVSTLAAPF